jgi:hypothetical protein
VIVPPDLFRDTPIRDIPDADLTPVQQAASETKALLQPLAAKAPGEVIRASDWNALAGAVQELANAVLQLTELVSPRGHAHPEIEEKFDEVQGNIRRFADAFGRSLLELRRDIEAQRLRGNVQDVLITAGASDAIRNRVLEQVTTLERNVQADTAIFTRNLTQAGNLILTEINELANAQGAEAQTFLELPAVQQLTETARSYVTTGTQVRPEAELNTYTRTMTAALKGRL